MIFDFLKKKVREEPKSQHLIFDIETDDNSPSWDVITAELEKAYPQQKNPKYYGTLVKHTLGGSDPLDGISVYDAGDFWHFVGYGLSKLHCKESNKVTDGDYRIELTFKFKKTSSYDEEEMCGVCNNLQKIAKDIFSTGNLIFPNQYIYTKQTEGININRNSLLTGFLSASDDLLDTLDTPYGKLTFIALIGATDAELRAIYEKELTVLELLNKLDTQVTDYSRKSII